MKTIKNFIIAAISLANMTAFAASFSGVEFPQGAISFADAVTSYSPGSSITGIYKNPIRALGTPDWVTATTANTGSVSLGRDGELIVQFTDNALTTSGDEALDLWLFEVGSAENFNVAISTDNSNWIDVGDVNGLAGIDIDAVAGVTAGESYHYVRLRDILPNQQLSPFSEADIDAIGAITTQVNTPEPTYVLPTNEWHQISLPRDPSENNTVNDIFGDDQLGTYPTEWIVYRYETSTNSYVALSPTDTMNQGMGYWIIQQTGSDKTLDMPAASETTPLSAPEGCASNTCFQFPLATTTGSLQWQMIGHPFSQSELFSNSRIVTTTTTCNPCTASEAEAAGIFHNQLFNYNGSTYTVLNNTSNLDPWRGYWAATLNNSDGSNPSLLISNPLFPLESVSP